MKNNDFVNGGIITIAAMSVICAIYTLGKKKGYVEGLNFQKERTDIYNHGYTDGCKRFAKNEE